jgi:hypothetical protein
VAEDLGHAAVRREDRGEDADRRGLAGPVRAEEAEDRPAGDVEIDPVQRDDVPEPLAQSLDVDRGVSHEGVLSHGD